MDLHAELADEAKAWQQEHGEVPPAAPATPAASSSSPAAAPQPEAEEPAEKVAAPTEEQNAMAAQLSTFAWGVLDTFVPKYLGKRMKLEPAEFDRLVALTSPVIAKRLPDVDGALSEEEMLLMGAAFIYGPKYFSPEPAKPEGSPAGGSSPADADPSGTTSATVDGKSVSADVLPIKKAAP